MWDRLINSLKLPVFEHDDEKTRKAGLTYTTLLYPFMVITLYVIIELGAIVFFDAPVVISDLLITGFAALFWLTGLVLVKRGFVEWSGRVVVAGAWIGTTTLCVIYGGVYSVTFTGYGICILMAGLLLDERAVLATTGISILAGMAMLYVQSTVARFEPVEYSPLAGAYAIYFVQFGIIAILIMLANRGMAQAFTQVRNSERELCRKNQILQVAEARYRSLFEDSPISLWEEDFSAVKAYLDELRAGGVSDFRAWFEENPDSVSQCASLVRIIRVNQASLRLFGAADEAKLTESLTKIFDENSLEVFCDELIAFAEGKTLFVEESTHRTLENELRYTAVSVSLAPGCEETWSKVFVSIMDITERVQSEQARRESEDRFETAFRTSPDSISINRLKDGIYIDVNEGFTALTGFSAAEVIGRTSSDINIWANPQDRVRLVEGIMSSGEVTGLEAELKLKDGSVRTGLMSARIITVSGEPCILSRIRDITERKQAEEAVRISEARLAESQRIAHIGSWVWDITTNETHWSDEAYRIAGFSPGEFTPTYQSVIDSIHPDDRELVQKSVENTLNQKEPYSLDYRIMLPDGRQRHVHAQGEVTFDEMGEPIRLAGTSQDITERKQAEEAVRASEEAARAFLEKLQILHEVSIELSQTETLDDLYRETVESGTKRLGFDRLGLFLRDFEANKMIGAYGVDQHGQVKAIPDLNLDIDSEDSRIQQTLLSKDGANLWEDVPLFDDHGHVVGHGWNAAASVLYEDRTVGWLVADNLFRQQPFRPYLLGLLKLYGATVGQLVMRRRAEEALRLSEARYRALVANVPGAAIILLDRDFRCVLVDGPEVEGAGFSKVETEGKMLREFLSPDLSAQLEQIAMAVFAGEAMTYESVSPRNNKIYWTSYVPLVNEQGDVMNVLSLNMDITERKMAEEAVRQLNEELEQRVQERTRQLEVINGELESFAYSVSHDLRAPLRSIDGFSQALLEDYRDVLDSEGQDYLRRVRAASQRMGQLIDDLLKLSRITRQEMNYETVDLSRLARDVVAELQQSDPERHVEFVITEGMIARGDTNLLRIVLNNLLSNAWKFTARRTQPVIQCYEMIHDGDHVFVVKDNGVGFEMQYAEKLFGAFQRLHSVSDYEGTGIGLATVQRIIHRHGGRIWAEASLNEGAAFYFTLA